MSTNAIIACYTRNGDELYFFQFWKWESTTFACVKKCLKLKRKFVSHWKYQCESLLAAVKMFSAGNTGIYLSFKQRNVVEFAQYQAVSGNNDVLTGKIDPCTMIRVAAGVCYRQQMAATVTKEENIINEKIYLLYLRLRSRRD